jgi:hypothetical protein
MPFCPGGDLPLVETVPSPHRPHQEGSHRQCGRKQLPWGQRPTRCCHRIGPHRLIIWRGAKPLLRKDAPHAGQRGQAVGRRARSARTASTRWTARTRATCHAARISAGSAGSSSIARRRRYTDGSSSRMLLVRHSIGNGPRLETLVRGSKSVPHFRYYASPPPTRMCALVSHFRYVDLRTVLFELLGLFL